MRTLSVLDPHTVEHKVMTLRVVDPHTVERGGTLTLGRGRQVGSGAARSCRWRTG